MLIGKQPVQAAAQKEVVVSGRKVATIKAGAGGRVVVEFEPGAIKPDMHQQLHAMLGKFLEH